MRYWSAATLRHPTMSADPLLLGLNRTSSGRDFMSLNDTSRTSPGTFCARPPDGVQLSIKSVNHRRLGNGLLRSTMRGLSNMLSVALVLN
jgi:hypothetical protein